MPYLIRHADAGNKHHWAGPDHDRPLSPPGQLEAHGLLGRLRDYPITRILTSPAVRCQQTVAPLSQRRAVPIEPVDTLAVDAPAARLLALVADPTLQTAVLCTHGELIGQLMRQLAAGGVPLSGPLDWDKGSTWVLTTSDGAVTTAHYMAPLRLTDLAGHFH
jgi:phosphohistidine phosphatase SixA